MADPLFRVRDLHLSLPDMTVRSRGLWVKAVQGNQPWGVFWSACLA